VATARDRQAMGDLGGAGDEMMALRMDVTDEGEVSAGVATRSRGSGELACW
jgi:hypothetical protein